MDEKGLAQEIGMRIASARNELGLSQLLLAERVGITRERLAGYEKGRGCLRCGIALELCRNLVISEKWLATGKGRQDLYQNVASLFPDELKNRSFLELYGSVVVEIYERKKKTTKGTIHFQWKASDNPETLKIACFKHASFYSKTINDPVSLVLYWSDLARCAEEKGKMFSVPPRERMSHLNDRRILYKNGTIVPFSYERFFDDLKLIGLSWFNIQELAEEVTSAYGREDPPIPISKIKETVYQHLQGIDLSDGTNYSALYEKLHMKDEK
jgi:transcriptional regulator with XRE-family HTH domain